MQIRKITSIRNIPALLYTFFNFGSGVTQSITVCIFAKSHKYSRATTDTSTVFYIAITITFSIRDAITTTYAAFIFYSRATTHTSTVFYITITVTFSISNTVTATFAAFIPIFTTTIINGCS